MCNLAMDRIAHLDLIVTMKTKLEAVIKMEIGVDDGHELPNIPFIDREVDLQKTG